MAPPNDPTVHSLVVNPNPTHHAPFQLGDAGGGTASVFDMLCQLMSAIMGSPAHPLAHLLADLYNSMNEMYGPWLLGLGTRLADHLDDQAGLPKKKVMSLIDVPGLTASNVSASIPDHQTDP